MVFILIYMLRDCLFAVIADMVFILIYMLRDCLFAIIADMVFICVIMQTYISAFSAHTVFPLMCFTCHNHGLCLTIGLAVLNTADYRLNIIKRYTVGAKVCYVNIFINKHYINNIFSVGFYAKRFFIRTEYKRVQFSLGKLLICYQIGYKHNSAVIYGIYSYLLCILKEYAKGKLV